MGVSTDVPPSVTPPTPPSSRPPTSPPPVPPIIINQEEGLTTKKVPLDEMSDNRYTTTTVVETTEYMADDGPAVRFGIVAPDCTYIRTLGGIMKCVCIALCILCFLCVLIGGPGYYSGAGWATFVSSVGLSITTTLLLLYVFRVVDAVSQFNWIVAEMCFCFAWTIFFFISGSVLAAAAAQYKNTAGWAVASFFAFGGMCAYGFDCYLKFLSWRNNEVATGGGSDFIAEQRRRANV